jgi:DNA polymerase II small subunit
MKKEILKTFAENGILADPEAVDAISQASDAMRCVDIILQDENRPLVLTKSDVDNYLTCETKFRPIAPTTEIHHEARAPSWDLAHERGGEKGEDIKILKDITGDSTCVGNVIDFAKLFNDRFSALKKILARRRELTGLAPIAKVKKVRRDIKFIGIINDIRTTKNGHTMIDLEDEEDKIQVLLMKGSKSIDTFVKDEVVGVVGSFSKDGEIVVAKEIVRPEVPINSGMIPNGSDSIVAFVSDIHVGSAEFLGKEWDRFVNWLNKDPAATNVRYIIVPGDLVDGIGIYPDQEDELVIEDVYAQYTELARLMRGIPERIKIVMMPGNHDAVRLAEPQPALPESITKMFDSRIRFVGNPCYMEIEGRIILAYHGRSMDDFISGIHSLSYNDPAEIMREMLRRRHMAPIYGERTAIAPEQKDYLVIDRVPNIFVTGHVHACAVEEYRGIKLINASAWQSQTSFQRMHNQIPDPAKVPMVNLGSGRVWVEDFSS